MTLALFGGRPAIGEKFAPYNPIGEEEALAAAAVVRSGVLSGYVGTSGPAFMGGPQVQALEAEAAEMFGVRHCLAVNSWTSGLIAAVGALGLEPGDEVITSPWTMAATATAILHWGAVPRFADIDAQTFNIDVASVSALVGPRTRAILAPDIFGQSADIEGLLALAEKHGLVVISDTAQAPWALRNGKLAGTQAHMGGYSLNRHKHVHCGEGGLFATDDADYFERAALIRNHGEVLLGQGAVPKPRHGIIGYNFRMGEVEAAISRVQLTRLPEKVASRQVAAERLRRGLEHLPGLDIASVAPGNTHVYYMLAMTVDTVSIGASLESVHSALIAEGVPGLGRGYQNIHRLPLFAEHLAFGTKGFPFAAGTGPDDCPVAEDLHSRVMCVHMCAHDFDDAQVDLVVEAFSKVWANLEEIVGADTATVDA